MMGEVRLLIDTNIVIGLEDPKEVEASFSELIRKCNERGIHFFVHEASDEDVLRDKNVARRSITLSKLAKFERLRGVAIPSDDQLVSRFGPFKSPNDRIDAI